MILGLVLWNQSTYTDGASLTNHADDIASMISQAQVYGIGVKEFTPGSSNFGTAYGVAFSLYGLNASNKAYMYFADRNGDKFYNHQWACPQPTPPAAPECLTKIDITRNNIISKLCYLITPNTCVSSPAGDLGRADITFARPNIEAQFVLQDVNQAQIYPLPSGFIGVRIELTSPKGATRSVTVYKTGQVSVQ